MHEEAVVIFDHCAFPDRAIEQLGHGGRIATRSFTIGPSAPQKTTTPPRFRRHFRMAWWTGGGLGASGHTPGTLLSSFYFGCGNKAKTFNNENQHQSRPEKHQPVKPTPKTIRTKHDKTRPRKHDPTGHWSLHPMECIDFFGSARQWKTRQDRTDKTQHTNTLHLAQLRRSPPGMHRLLRTHTLWEPAVDLHMDTSQDPLYARILRVKHPGPRPGCTLYASLRSRNAYGRFTRAIWGGNLQEQCPPRPDGAPDEALARPLYLP